MIFKKVIIFPTDTVYGIGTGLFNDEGLKKIYDLKKRDINKDIPVLFSNFDHLKPYIIITPLLKQIGTLFFPGPLTIVVNATQRYYDLTGKKTLAIRMPNHLELLEMLEQTGPLLTTSLNDSGKMPLEDIQEIIDKYQILVDEIITFKNVDHSQISSTIIDITTDNVQLLREGTISLKTILDSLNL